MQPSVYMWISAKNAAFQAKNFDAYFSDKREKMLDIKSE
jgi:hypothetical protein